MTRDNVLFILIGILIGFIAGYLMQEVMLTRQPARLVHGDGAQAGAPSPGGGGPGAGARTNQQAAAQARAQEIAQLRSYLESNPEDERAVLRLANLSYDGQSWSDCIQYYERFLELEPGQPDVLSDLGVCYQKIGEPQQALEAFDRAQEIAPDHWQSRFNEVVILAFDLGDFERAEQVLEELRELQPDNPNIERLAEEVARRQAAS